ncbi:MAG TPA: S53 family peptidase [Candidatus Saccharimonadales bacterium]|nr:S53 family peptidase [Candidatus Saccharimonadales bacterium]
MKKLKNQQAGHFHIAFMMMVVLAVIVSVGVVTVRHVRHPSLASAEEQAQIIRATPAYDVMAKKAIFASNASVFEPARIRTAYKVPATSTGSGTIAIIDAYDYPAAEQDLKFFNDFFALRSCTTANGCFEKHKMAAGLPIDPGWETEMALDTQWAHAIAPTAKILLVEAKSNLISDFLDAIDYAKSRADVVAISMSWGANEFAFETTWDSRLVSTRGVAFTAAAGDSGNNVWWPAASPTVIGVGGTTLTLNGDDTIQSEVAWSSGGGGLSVYESEPAYQLNYNIPSASGSRGTPDVSYVGDPNTGLWIYSQGSWWQIGGTSAGTPVWAALRAINSRVNLSNLYADGKSSNSAAFFRDITSGNNGGCGTYCDAGTGYDYVTGLGSPVSSRF